MTIKRENTSSHASRALIGTYNFVYNIIVPMSTIIQSYNAGMDISSHPCWYYYYFLYKVVLKYVSSNGTIMKSHVRRLCLREQGHFHLCWKKLVIKANLCNTIKPPSRINFRSGDIWWWGCGEVIIPNHFNYVINWYKYFGL